MGISHSLWVYVCVIWAHDSTQHPVRKGQIEVVLGKKELKKKARLSHGTYVYCAFSPVLLCPPLSSSFSLLPVQCIQKRNGKKRLKRERREKKEREGRGRARSDWLTLFEAAEQGHSWGENQKGSKDKEGVLREEKRGHVGTNVIRLCQSYSSLGLLPCRWRNRVGGPWFFSTLEDFEGIEDLIRNASWLWLKRSAFSLYTNSIGKLYSIWKWLLGFDLVFEKSCRFWTTLEAK